MALVVLLAFGNVCDFCDSLRGFAISANFYDSPQFIPLTLVIWIISLCDGPMFQNFPEFLCAVFSKDKKFC